MKMTRNKILISIFGTALLLFSGVLYATSASIDWTPSRYAPVSIIPGQSTTTTVTFTNRGPSTINGSKLVLEITGDAAPIVTAATLSFPITIKKGESVSVQLTVQTTSDMPMKVIEGSLVLSETVPNGTTKSVFKKTLPIEITISPFPLPPAPDKAIDESTIAGIDTEANGVPDRVDRWIGFTAPDSEKKRMAMTLSARVQQFFLTDFLAHKNDDPALLEARVKGNDLVRIKTINCLRFAFGADVGFEVEGGRELWKKFDNTSHNLDELFYDTPARLRNFREAERPLVATGFPEIRIEDLKQECLSFGFDPDQLPN